MSTTTPPAESHSAFVAVLLLAIALIMVLASQRIGLMRQQTQLAATHQSQEQLLGQSKNVRSQFQAIMQGTSQLAAEGNQTATTLLAELEKRGVKVRSNSEKSPVSEVP